MHIRPHSIPLHPRIAHLHHRRGPHHRPRQIGTNFLSQQWYEWRTLYLESDSEVSSLGHSPGRPASQSATSSNVWAVTGYSEAY